MVQTVVVAILSIAVLVVVLGVLYREPSPRARRLGPTDQFTADFPRRWRGYDPAAVESRLAALRLAWAVQQRPARNLTENRAAREPLPEGQDAVRPREYMLNDDEHS